MQRPVILPMQHSDLIFFACGSFVLSASRGFCVAAALLQANLRGPRVSNTLKQILNLCRCPLPTLLHLVLPPRGQRLGHHQPHARHSWRHVSHSKIEFAAAWRHARMSWCNTFRPFSVLPTVATACQHSRNHQPSTLSNFTTTPSVYQCRDPLNIYI